MRSSRLLVIAAVTIAADNRARGHSKALDIQLITWGVFVGLSLVIGVVAWAVTRWRLEPDALCIDTGLLRRDSRRLPVNRIQAVDMVEPFLGRIIGLAELRVRLAGASGSRGRLSYLPRHQADQLRQILLAAAQAAAPSSPDEPEQLIVTVPTGRLLASVATSVLGTTLMIVVTLGVVLALVFPSGLAIVAGSSSSVLLSLATGIWQRVSTEFRFTAARAHDGLRLKAGLLQTISETIPTGRIQAVKQIEPFLWRAFGWRRIIVDVAGGASNRTGRRGGQVSRALLPVGSAAEADVLLRLVLGDYRVPTTRPPGRARLKAPLGYHFLAAGYDQTHAVTVNGRLRRNTCWVPLEKVQSVRRLEGPVQRRLQLSSVHLDTAGRSVHAVLRDRDGGDADRGVEDLAFLCRAARVATAGGLSPG